MKTLISWLAYNNDFESGHVNPQGPTVNLHKFFYLSEKYDRHIILSQKTIENIRIEKIVSYLQNEFPDRKIQKELLTINDPIDLKEVKTKVEQILLKNRDDDIEIFISPGTSMMQLAWYICHTTLGLNTKLFQLRPSRFSESDEPEKLYLEFSSSDIPRTAIIAQESLEKKDTGEYLITASLQPVYNKAYKIAQTDKVNTLILGATGTGKEHLSRYIHDKSVRSNNKFMSLNCSAFNDQLLESRLFGYMKGSFTGADKDVQGLFEKADGGTIFLDEIGDISPYMQQSLLRVIQEKEVVPIGGVPLKIDVRIIAATHRNLVEMCRQEKFRWDLYYRLNVAPLELPALQDRGISEVEDYLRFFLKQKKKELGKKRTLKLSAEANRAMVQYTYPGNIRELENTIERLYIFSENEVQLSDLPSYIRQNVSNKHTFNLESCEKILIDRALAFFNGNQTKTAKAMGIALNTLKNKMKKYEITRIDYKS